MRLQTLYLYLSIPILATAHYAFPTLIINQTVSEKWQYVRNVTPTYTNYDQTTYEPALYPLAPLTDITSSDIRCGRNGAFSGPETEIADVLAGTEVGFGVYQGPLANPVINHNGPAFAYLSRSPGDTVAELRNYTGDGVWFKIGYVGPVTRTTWRAAGANQLNFTIPPTTPPGKYLLRVEHLSLLPRVNETQFYVNCAQVNVLGGGGGTPGPLAKFPGAYDAEDKGILVGFDIAFPDEGRGSDLFGYVGPGPVVWSG